MTLALTHSSWINAWTLRRACAALGVDLRVAPGPRQMPLPVLSAPGGEQWLFFTEEASLRRALTAMPPPRGRFLPTAFPLELLDDKWAFAQYLAADPGGPQGLAQWTLQYAEQARFPLILKARHSWVGERKLPRGWVCADAGELAARRAALPGLDLREDWFFLQEWLGAEGAHEVLSVAGFYDGQAPRRSLALLTRRLADYGGGGPSSSAMLATVADARGLIPATERVLARLGYRGPYEMEFIAAGGRCVMLELNPRFWMQHGLYLARGNALVRRYLGLDAAEAEVPPDLPQLWVDGFWLLRRVARLDLRVLADLFDWRYRRGHRLVFGPSLPAVMGTLLWRLFGGGRA